MMIMAFGLPAEYGSGLSGSVPPVRLTTVTDVKDQDHESAVVNLV